MNDTYLETLSKEIFHEILLNLDISDLKNNFLTELISEPDFLRKVIHRDFSDKINTSFMNLDVVRNLDLLDYISFKRFYHMKTYRSFFNILFSDLDLDLSYEDMLQIEKLFEFPYYTADIFKYYVFKTSSMYLFMIDEKGISHTKFDEDVKELRILTTEKILHNILFYFHNNTIFKIRECL